MGYIEDLLDKRLAEFNERLITAKDKNPDKCLFDMDLSTYTFACNIKDGFALIKKMTKLLTVMRENIKLTDKLYKISYKEFKAEIEEDDRMSSAMKTEILEKAKAICDNATVEKRKNFKKIRCTRNELLLRTCNSFVYLISIMLSTIFGAVLYTFNNVVANFIIYPLSGIAIILFVILQIIYTLKYLKAIDADKQATILFWIKRAFSTLLVIWWYVAVITIVNSWNIDIAINIFAAIFVLYIIFMIYDLFLSSALFDEAEGYLSLIAAIIVGIFIFTDSFGNQVISQAGAIFLLIACLLLTLLIIKKFFIEKRSVKNFLEFFYVVLIIVSTIILTIVAFYKLLWIKSADGQVVDNTLFSAVVGVYAAIVGGGLTLTGVVWTIKSGKESREEDFRRIETERNEQERKKYIPYVKHVTREQAQVEASESIFREIDFENEEVTAQIQDNVLFMVSIYDFKVKNISDTNILLSGIIIDETFYPFDKTRLLERNEVCVITTKGLCILPKLDAFGKMFLVLNDILGNIYHCECQLKIVDVNSSHDHEINGKKYIEQQHCCHIEAIDLPNLR